MHSHQIYWRAFASSMVVLQSILVSLAAADGRNDPLTLTGHKTPVWDVSFSSDGATLVSSSSGYQGKSPNMRLWSVRSRQELHSFSPHHEWVFDVGFLPSGKFIISRGADQNGYRALKIWDSQSGILVRTLQAEKHDVHAMVTSHDGSLIASTGYLKRPSYDNNIRVWGSRTGATRFINPGHVGGTWCLAFSPSGETLVTGGEDEAIRIWDINSGELVTVVEQTKPVYGLAFSPNGKVLASGSGDGWEQRRKGAHQQRGGATRQRLLPDCLLPSSSRVFF